jgi:hypothetical protein
MIAESKTSERELASSVFTKPLRIRKRKDYKIRKVATLYSHSY